MAVMTDRLTAIGPKEQVRVLMDKLLHTLSSEVDPLLQVAPPTLSDKSMRKLFIQHAILPTWGAIIEMRDAYHVSLDGFATLRYKIALLESYYQTDAPEHQDKTEHDNGSK
jgi:hypothetical protein